MDPSTPFSGDTAAVRILHIEDSREDHVLVQFALRRHHMPCTLTLVDSLEGLRQALREQVFDIVLADYHLPGFTGLDAWSEVQQQHPGMPFVLLSGAIGEEAAVDAMHRGVSDYLLKDSLPRLAHVIWRAMEVTTARSARAQAAAELAESRLRLAALAEHLQLSIEQERADISREIHDDIGGALAAVKLDLAWVSRHAVDPMLQGHLSSALEMLQHALEASQRIMKNLRPPILEQGLVAALQWLGQSVERRAGLRVMLRHSAEVILAPREVQLVAYRTAQEALTNVIKHARASTVDMDLSDEEGVLTLEISDNGCGLDSQALKKAHSFGLLGLRERAAKVGGWLDVSSSTRGTSVILSVPLEEARAVVLAALADDEEQQHDSGDLV
jgi:two-component system sensor histidine kinase UhpB